MTRRRLRRSAALTVGEFREWLLDPKTRYRNADANGAGDYAGDGGGGIEDDAGSGSDSRRPARCRVVTRFREHAGIAGATVGAAAAESSDGRCRAGLPPSMLDGLLYGCGDAVIGVNPASDSVAGGDAAAGDDRTHVGSAMTSRRRTCVLAHVTNTLRRNGAGRAGGPGVPVDWRDGGGEPQLRGYPRAAR